MKNGSRKMKNGSREVFKMAPNFEKVISTLVSSDVKHQGCR